jgi:hypothetical protein
MPQHKKRRSVRRKNSFGVRRAPEHERYLLGIDDDEIDQLARGVCPETIALKCWELLLWQRDGARRNARELNGET